MLIVQKVGRKRLLLFSVLSMGSMSAVLAYGLDEGHRGLSAVAIVAFIVRVSSPVDSTDAMYLFGYRS
jgi:hypothetical protein